MGGDNICVRTRRDHLNWCYDQDRVKAYIKSKIGGDDIDSTAMGIEHEGKLICAVLYFNYQPKHGDIEMSLVSDDPKCCNNKRITGFFRYPFTQLGCKRVTAQVEADNARCLRLLKFFGFKEEGVKRLGFQGKKDLILCGLLRDEFKWLEEPEDQWLSPEEIVPIHEPWDLDKIDMLYQSMEKHGWVGNAIPILSTDRNYAMTGTHRIYAAKLAAIKVKVHYVDTKRFTEDVYLKALRDAGELYTADLIEDELKKGNVIHGSTERTKTPASA